MKKLLILLAICLPLIATCARGGRDAGGGDGFSVALLINGTLGDRSFHDSANNGMMMIRDGLGVQIKVVEVGYDSSRWEPALRDLLDERHDIVVCGTWQMQEIVSRIAPEYPNQRIIVYDTSMDYDSDTTGRYRNIFSIEYKQNEGSFLAGVLAAMMSQTGIIGFVGGMDNTVIRDFLVGYIQGALAARPDIRVIPSFVGNFHDTARAMELTFAQYQMGVDVVFSVASNAGEGTLQAARERNNLVIGVDSDQALLYLDSDPVLANLIMSSMLKRVDQSIYLSMRQALDGTLAWGSRVALGLNEDSVGLADNEVFRRVVPADIRQVIDSYDGQIKRNEINVATAFGMDQATFNNIVDQVRP